MMHSNQDAFDALKQPETMQAMFAKVAPRYQMANHVMSLGMDIWWRRKLARQLKKLRPQGRLLDLASGTGDQLVTIKKMMPQLEAVAFDLSAPMLKVAEERFARLAPPQPVAMVGNALQLPFPPNTFGAVSISFGLRNIAPRAELYRQVLSALRPGGHFIILEIFNNPKSRLSRPMRFYLKHVLPWLGGRLVAKDPASYQYLSASVMAFPPPEVIADEMRTAGFKNVGHRCYTMNTAMLVWGSK